MPYTSCAHMATVGVKGLKGMPVSFGMTQCLVQIYLHYIVFTFTLDLLSLNLLKFCCRFVRTIFIIDINVHALVLTRFTLFP